MTTWKNIALTALASFAAGVAAPVSAQTEPLPISQAPLYLQTAVPPLNMLVMGRDHKLYYEAYNDASDLDGDGALDVGYKPGVIEYYGYFNSAACYSYAGGATESGLWSPTGPADETDRSCGSGWSGDFLNYLTTARIDALRKVLYGGLRDVDTDAQTVLQRSYIPQDAHSFGKEYTSEDVNGFLISDYSDLDQPAAGRRHLFASTSLSDNGYPRLRVLTNSPFRVWNWLSIERPVAGADCFNDSNNRVTCAQAGGAGVWEQIPQTAYPAGAQASYYRRSGSTSPVSSAAMTTMETASATSGRLCGTETLYQVARALNPFDGVNSCTNDNFFSRVTGQLVIPAGVDRIAVNGDDAIDFALDGTLIASWYGGHGGDSSAAGLLSHSGAVSAGTYNFRLRHEEGSGGQLFELWWRRNVPSAPAAVDYAVRVEVCPEGDDNADVREPNCRQYPDGNWKPTGLLHDYGEADRMFFGLLTGSQYNNLQGGVLRSEIGSFREEVDSDTGVFETGVDGIVANLDAFRPVGFRYASDYLWSFGSNNCPALGTRALANGECRMWGNPIGEMMFEALRYYAGAAAPTDAFSEGDGSLGDAEESTLGLSSPDWSDPYAAVEDGGLGFKACAKPVMTVISDINPSYDSNLPGGAWGDIPSFDLPDTISSFNASAAGGAIWAHEIGGSQSVFIGEVGATADSAPSAKSASSFGNIRGLSPEEPTKQGTYYSAAVAYYGWTNDKVNELSDERLRTYAVALASPLPRVSFPVGGGTVSLVPFAKTVGGAFSVNPDNAFQPTNTIVDFYVERIVNLPGQEEDNSDLGNNGRPLAIFRINYEDVEQGNDHDMDAIVRYEVRVNEDDSVTVRLNSEYAAGGADQYMGYIISGTTADGIYLEVRDVGGANRKYRLNTPPGQAPGYCSGGSAAPDACNGLPLTASREFEVGTSSSALSLKDPLWYAAKYGGFSDDNGNGVPDGEEWDEDGDGVPDKYFLVTNALNLKDQLSKAFSEIENDARAAGGVAASGARRDGDFLAYVPEYNADDWTGDLKAFELDANGRIDDVVWSANDRLPDADDRLIYVSRPSGTGFGLEAFEVDSFDGELDAILSLGYANQADLDTRFGPGTTVEEVIEYLRGDTTNEERLGGTFRDRSRLIGDILGSQPEVLSSGGFGYASLPEAQGGGFTGAGSYGEFLTNVKAEREPVIFVGSNGGMLHAFNASADDALGGVELFSIIPATVLGEMDRLPEPAYPHRYFVDASPTQGDARISGEWKTVLLSGFGGGGRGVIALDVTDAAAGFNPDTDLLWEINAESLGVAEDEDGYHLGLTYGRGAVALLEDGNWYAVFGNGYNSESNQAALYVVALETGNVERVIPVGEGTEEDPNGLGQVSLIDANFDGITDTVYAGDYHGALWKFDLSGGSSGSWQAALGDDPLFVAEDRDGARQNITGSIEIGLHPLEGFIVYFGTGRYFLDGDNEIPTDPVDRQVQTFYAIWDNEETAVASRDTLLEQTIVSEVSGDSTVERTLSTSPINWLERDGWFVDLVIQDGEAVAQGERFIGTPRLALGSIIFTTFTPVGSECEPGGINWAYVLNGISGSNEASVQLGGGISAPPATEPPLVTEIKGPPSGDDDPPPCTGDDCPPPCEGDDCPCEGDDCPPDCEGEDCPCEGADCDDEDDPPPPNGLACTIELKLLLSDGLNTLAAIPCGRQSWRQLE